MGSTLKGSRHAEIAFDADAMRAALRPLDIGPLTVRSGEEQRYFHHYGIDFAHRVPGVVHHFGSVDIGDHRIAVHLYQTRRARGSCVLLHGYYDHAGLYGHLIEHCLRRDQDVLIWDLPGHGLSSGEQASIHSFDVYADVHAALLEQLGPLLPKPWTAIGQSTGAAVLMNQAFRDSRAARTGPFARLALLAPLVMPAGWYWIRVAYWLLRPLRRSIAREFMDNSGDAAFLDFVRNDPLQSQVLPIRWVGAMRAWIHAVRDHPVCDVAPIVVQGDLDDTVDWRRNLPLIRAAFPQASVVTIPGARHHLVNETPELREQVFAAIGL